MRLDRDRLLRAREMLGYGIETTAQAAGVSKNSVLRAEHGEDIRPLTARKIARALGVPVADLLPKAQSPLPLEGIAKEWGWEQAPPEDISGEQRALLEREDSKAFQRAKTGEKPQAFFAGDTGQVIRVHPALLFVTLAELDRLSKENLSLRSKLEKVGAA